MSDLKVLTSSNSDEWETPQSFFDAYNKIFNFTLDPCCTKKTAKCEKFFTEEDNGLSKSWANEVVWLNPPYSRKKMKHFIKKAYNEYLFFNATVVSLIPSRTDTIYFHDYVAEASELHFLKGRLKFIYHGQHMTSAPFPSMVVIWSKHNYFDTINTPFPCLQVRPKG
jgi:site-specific DNA-methyltransferase (adenine-specific)